MTPFATKHLPVVPDAIAPDGSHVRLLHRLDGGNMAHFELGPGRVSAAVTHRTVEEIWFFLSGRGQMWRKQGDVSEIVDLYPGIALTIPLGTHFQFRSFGFEPLAAVSITMPPWPSDDEAYEVEGAWDASLT